MAAIEEGRICVKNAGRDAGRFCAIVKKIDDKTVEIISAGRKKRRKAAMRHLEPLAQKLELKGTDAEIAEALRKLS